MKFFIPYAARAESADVYAGIVKSVQEQMRTTIAPRKIFSLSYVHDKKQLKAEVGQPDPQSGRYEVFAILESSPYVVFTHNQKRKEGLLMLVNKDEVTDVVEFE